MFICVVGSSSCCGVYIVFFHICIIVHSFNKGIVTSFSCQITTRWCMVFVQLQLFLQFYRELLELFTQNVSKIGQTIGKWGTGSCFCAPAAQNSFCCGVPILFPCTLQLRLGQIHQLASLNPTPTSNRLHLQGFVQVKIGAFWARELISMAGLV